MTLDASQQKHLDVAEYTYHLDVCLNLQLGGPLGGDVWVAVAFAGVSHVGVNPPRVHVIHFTHLLLQHKHPGELLDRVMSHRTDE